MFKKNPDAKLIEKLKLADEDTQVRQCCKLAIEGDWRTAKNVGGAALVTKVAHAIEKAKDKIALREKVLGR